MLENYIHRKIINRDLLLAIREDVCDLLPNFELYFCELDDSCVLRYNLELICFGSYQELYDYLEPLLIDLVECQHNEEKKERIIRDMLINACEDISVKYRNCKFTVSIAQNDKES